MYNKFKIGVGIVTCNRQASFRRLFEQVKTTNADEIIVVKNKKFDYNDDDPMKLTSDKQQYTAFNVVEDIGVGYCKNICLKELVKHSCLHIFIVEDDISIKNTDVFNAYIETAIAFKLHHLNFCMAWDSITKKYLFPAYSILNKDGAKLSIFNRLCGDFEYFTSDAIVQAGLFDAKHYVNALEHAEHTYRIAQLGLTTPFKAFADIYHSSDYIEDTGIQSSLHYDAESYAMYNLRVQQATLHFFKTYNTTIGQIHTPTQAEVQTYLYTNGELYDI